MKKFPVQYLQNEMKIVMINAQYIICIFYVSNLFKTFYEKKSFEKVHIYL